MSLSRLTGMTPSVAVIAVVVAGTCGLAACTEEVGPGPSTTSSGAGAGSTVGSGGGSGIDVSGEGTPLSVEVPADDLVYVDLDEPATTDADGGWELAFTGYDVFTNSGVSGPGDGGAFGPLDAPLFLLDDRPEVPFLLEDRTGGAFLGWYAYEGASHALWSRYHVVGVRDGDDFYKVQILSYYGEIQGAPVSAVYRLRWAAASENGVGPTQALDDADGTAGGLAGGPDDPSECLDLGSGERTMLTVAQAQTSTAWHLCFRRDSISVNGELGGPRGVGAVDLGRLVNPEGQTLEVVKQLTAENTLPAFDAVGYEDLADPMLVYRGDRVVSAFDTRWYVAGESPTPAPATWLVQRSDGKGGFLVYFESFDGADAASPGTVTLRVKVVP